MLIYFIVEEEDRIPILTASSLDKVKELLDEYMGYPIDNDVEFIKFEAWDNCGHPDIYEGQYIYKYYGIEQKFLRYCMELNNLD